MSDEMIRPRRGRPPAAAGMLASLDAGAAAPSAAPAEAPATAPQATRADMTAAREGRGRNRRQPLGGGQQKLAVAPRPGYSRRWFNDVGDRLDRAQAAGYEFADEGSARSTDTGTRKSQVVGTNADGTPMRAYLMEIPLEWYDQDQAAKQEKVAEVDAQIKAGNVNGTVGVDGRYVPKIGIKYDIGA